MAIKEIAFEKKTELKMTYEEMRALFSKKANNYSMDNIVSKTGGMMYFYYAEIASNHKTVEQVVDYVISLAKKKLSLSFD